jgi:hypothetical protein
MFSFILIFIPPALSPAPKKHVRAVEEQLFAFFTFFSAGLRAMKPYAGDSRPHKSAGPNSIEVKPPSALDSTNQNTPLRVVSKPPAARRRSATKRVCRRGVENRPRFRVVSQDNSGWKSEKISLEKG